MMDTTNAVGNYVPCLLPASFSWLHLHTRCLHAWTILGASYNMGSTLESTILYVHASYVLWGSPQLALSIQLEDQCKSPGGYDRSPSSFPSCTRTVLCQYIYLSLRPAYVQPAAAAPCVHCDGYPVLRGGGRRCGLCMGWLATLLNVSAHQRQSSSAHSQWQLGCVAAPARGRRLPHHLLACRKIRVRPYSTLYLF